MNKKPVITSPQLLLMAVGSALVFPYTFLPILITPPANQDVWIVLWMAIPYVLVLNAPLLFLMNKFRGMNFNQMAEALFGKFLGKVILVPFVLFFLYCFTACMLITAQFINIYILQATPMWAVVLLAALPATYASYKGAGTIGRLAAFIVPFVMGSILFFFLLGTRKMDLSILQPILADSTFLQLNQGAFYTAARFSEILIFLVFSFYLKKKASITRTYLTAIGVFAVNFSLILLPTILVLGMDLAEHIWNPYYMFASQVEAFNFLERLQSINMLTWFPMALLKLTMYNHMGSYVLSGIVKTKSHKPFVIPLSIIGVAVCMIPFVDDSNFLLKLRSDQVFPWITIPVIFVLPLIFLIAYLIRRKSIEQMLQNNAAE